MKEKLIKGLTVKEYHREYMKAYRKTHKKKPWPISPEQKLHVRHYMRQYMKKYLLNPKNRIDANVRSFVCVALKGGKAGRSWEKLVGYTLDDLVVHLERQFDNMMNWENYGSYWALDHIKPRALFNYKTAEEREFKECWALSNLQPLEKIANKKKNDKYTLIS